MAMLNAKCLNLNKPQISIPTAKLPQLSKPISLSSTPAVPRSLISSSAIAGAVFSAIGSSDPAFAAQQIAAIAEGSDNRGTLLLIVVTPAIAWVLFNILQPALNQINRMRDTKGVVAGLGLGGGIAGLMAATAPEASAAAAEAAGSDNRGTLLLIVVAPAILWVLYNILQPALNQINRMRS
ncbi:Photosystem II core complex proteins psbY, chloroplastic [Linum grandiflorum]